MNGKCENANATSYSSYIVFKEYNTNTRGRIAIQRLIQMVSDLTKSFGQYYSSLQSPGSLAVCLLRVPTHAKPRWRQDQRPKTSPQSTWEKLWCKRKQQNEHYPSALCPKTQCDLNTRGDCSLCLKTQCNNHTGGGWLRSLQTPKKIFFTSPTFYCVACWFSARLLMLRLKTVAVNTRMVIE